MPRLLTFILILFSFAAHAQRQVLKNFDFSQGDYTLMVLTMDSAPEKILYEDDSINIKPIVTKVPASIDTTDFYAEDAATLTLVKATLKAKPKNTQTNCSPDYLLYLFQKDSIVMTIELVVCSKEMIVDDNIVYNFDPATFTKLLPTFKRLESRQFKPNTREEALSQWSLAVADKDLLYISNEGKPDWLQAEGEFSMIFRERVDSDTLEDRIRKTIIGNYPGESFRVETSGGGYIPNELPMILINVKCNKSLYDKFGLRKKEDWRYFDNFSFWFYRKLD